MCCGSNVIKLLRANKLLSFIIKIIEDKIIGDV